MAVEKAKAEIIRALGGSEEKNKPSANKQAMVTFEVPCPGEEISHYTDISVPFRLKVVEKSGHSSTADDSLNLDPQYASENDEILELVVEIANEEVVSVKSNKSIVESVVEPIPVPPPPKKSIFSICVKSQTTGSETDFGDECDVNTMKLNVTFQVDFKNPKSPIEVDKSCCKIASCPHRKICSPACRGPCCMKFKCLPDCTSPCSKNPSSCNMFAVTLEKAKTAEIAGNTELREFV